MHTRIQNKESSKKTLERRYQRVDGGYTSMWQQDLQRTGNNGRTLCMPPTLQLEDGTRRRCKLIVDDGICIHFISFCECCSRCIFLPVHHIITSLVQGLQAAFKLYEWTHVDRMIHGLLLATCTEI